MFDFPSSPTDGQVYTPVGGPTYYWDATDTAWRLAGAKSGPGSGLDADTLDGHDTPYFAPQTALDTEASTRASADTTLQNNINLKADIASPTFTGDPKAPTPAVSDNDTSIATTAFVKSVAATIVPFPEAPTDGLTYGRKNATWATVIGGAYTDDLPPAPPLIDGQLWYKASTGVMYVYYDDGTSQQWVQVSASPQSPNQGFAVATALSRNLIVNPCGHISQELGNAAQTASGAYIADQWNCNFVVSPATVSYKSDGAVINPSGSTTRLLFKATAAKAALAAGDYAGFTTKLEAVRAYPLGYIGGAPVQSVLRFGFNGPAGTYSVAIRNLTAYTVTWTGQFTIAAGQANTDTTQVLVIPAPPTGYVWGTGSSAQIEMWITLAAGTNYMAPGNGWQAGSFLAGPGQFNLLGTINNQATIWDIGLYADPSRTGLPPPFQVPDYALDLFECMRYWQTIDFQAAGYCVAGQQLQIPKPFTVTMRVAPTFGTLAAGNPSNISAASPSAQGGRGFLILLTASATGLTAYYNNIQAAVARM
jgi:hypothetical protein